LTTEINALFKSDKDLRLEVEVESMLNSMLFLVENN